MNTIIGELGKNPKFVSLVNNIENKLNNTNVCSLVREGYGKGYFCILYNISSAIPPAFSYDFFVIFEELFKLAVK